MDKDDQKLRDIYSSANWDNLEFSWMDADGKTRIVDIIRACEDIDMTRRPMPMGFHSPMRGFDALPSMTFARQFDTEREIEMPARIQKKKDPKWPDEGIRFSVEISELVKHTDEKGRSWSPKVVIEIYRHKKKGIQQYRTDYLFNWAAYMYSDNWNDVIPKIKEAYDIYFDNIRSSDDLADWDF